MQFRIGICVAQWALVMEFRAIAIECRSGLDTLTQCTPNSKWTIRSDFRGLLSANGRSLCTNQPQNRPTRTKKKQKLYSLNLFLTAVGCQWWLSVLCSINWFTWLRVHVRLATNGWVSNSLCRSLSLSLYGWLCVFLYATWFWNSFKWTMAWPMQFNSVHLIFCFSCVVIGGCNSVMHWSFLCVGACTDFLIQFKCALWHIGSGRADKSNRRHTQNKRIDFRLFVSPPLMKTPRVCENRRPHHRRLPDGRTSHVSQSFVASLHPFPSPFPCHSVLHSANQKKRENWM